MRMTRKGATGVDYAIMLALITVVVLPAIILIGPIIRDAFSTANTSFASRQTAAFNATGQKRPGTDPLVMTFSGLSAAIVAPDQTGVGLINWGDGTQESFTGTMTHSYAKPGIYDVKVYGTQIPTLGSIAYSKDGGGAPLGGMQNLIAVKSFGNVGITKLDYAFTGLSNLQSLAALPASVTSLKGTFSYNTSVNSGVANWDVSNVTNLSKTFEYSTFNQPIGNWNTGAVTTMAGLFLDDTSFDQDISAWDVSKVTDMTEIFAFSPFNHSISTWNTASLMKMSSAFEGDPSFNQDISTWDVSRVSDFSRVFKGDASFNRSLDTWDVSKATTMEAMFMNAGAFNGNIADWKTAHVTNMSQMFSGSGFNGDISGWDVSGVQQMSYMFQNDGNFDGSIGIWKTAGVSNMDYMFSGAPAFNQDLSGWCVAKIPSKPTSFDAGATAWTLPEPAWGTCP